MKIGLVGCGKKKLNKPAPADQMYISRHFKAALRWSNSRCDKTFICSTKYGLLEPGSIIAPYDLSFSRSSAAKAPTMIGKAEREIWGAAVARKIKLITVPTDEIIFICGKSYWANIKPFLGDLKTSAPFQHDGLATRTKKMVEDLRNG